MKPPFGLVLATALFQAAPSPRPTASPLARPCVDTEHMPILGLRSRPPEHMPVFLPDSVWPSQMPTSKLIPCYLADSLAVAPHS